MDSAFKVCLLFLTDRFSSEYIAYFVDRYSFDIKTKDVWVRLFYQYNDQVNSI